MKDMLAFPVQDAYSMSTEQGMTLRDYFAARAMQGIMVGQYPITRELDAEYRISKAAYHLADAMMKARDK